MMIMMRRFSLVLLVAASLLTISSARPGGLTLGHRLLSRGAPGNTKRNVNLVASHRRSPHTNKFLSTRGGQGKRITTCGDSDKMIALKTAVSALLETVGLLAAFKIADMASPGLGRLLEKVNLPSKIGKLPILQWVSSVFVIFSSSTVKSWIEGGVGAATSQVLKPDVVPGDAEWYASLKKPWFNPPGWAFPIMWLVVSKPTQLLAVSRILQQTPTPYWPQLSVYCAHLSLGDAWNEVFFGCQRVGLGAYTIGTFYGMLGLSAKLFYDVTPAAGKLMLPTCGWVAVATALNISIYMKNR